MKHVSILIAFVLLIQGVQAQRLATPKLGKFTPDEIALMCCEFDSTATAVVLFDVGKTEFVPNGGQFNIRFTQHRRIKVLHADGMKHGRVSIPFYVGTGPQEAARVQSIKAYTYTWKNGKRERFQVKPDAISTQRTNQFWRRKVFVFPNIEPGAILEYSYVLETPNTFQLTKWYFQSRIPTLYSEYELRMVPFYEYVRLDQGIDSLDYQRSVAGQKMKAFLGLEYKEMKHTSAMKNVAAFQDEAYITSMWDFMMKFEFQLSKVIDLDGTVTRVIPTWQGLSKELLATERFGDYLRDCRKHARSVLREQLDTTNLNREQRIDKIVRFVKTSFSCNGQQDKVTTQSARTFFNRKAGNTAEINLFLLVLLQEAGIAAQPAILSTRDHGKLSMEYPIIRKFNYVLVYLEDEPTNNAWVDGTNPLMGDRMIPSQCMNGKALIIHREKSTRWVPVQYDTPSLTKTKIEVQVKPQEAIYTASVNLEAQSYTAAQYRDQYSTAAESIEQGFKEQLGAVLAFETRNQKAVDLPFGLSFEARKKLSVEDDQLMLQPFLGLPPTENILKQKTRNYPVDMLYPNQQQYEIMVNAPEGYALKTLPKPVSINNELVSVHFHAAPSTNKNPIRILAEYTFKKAVYPPEDYERLRAYFDQIVALFNAELVFEKEL